MNIIKLAEEAGIQSADYNRPELQKLLKVFAESLVKEALVPEITNEMKAVCMGEFLVETDQTCSACHFHGAQENCEICGGEITYTDSYDVPWTTMKDIYKLMSSVRSAGILRNLK